MQFAILMKRVIVIIVCVVVICCFYKLWKVLAPQSKIVLDVRMALQETFIGGGGMGGVILRSQNNDHKIPDISKLKPFLYEISRTHDISAERLSSWDISTNNTRLLTEFDGKGGWVFRQTDGSLSINVAKPVYLDKDQQSWIMPNEIKFSGLIQIKIRGKQDSEFQQYLRKLESLAMDYRESVLLMK